MDPQPSTVADVQEAFANAAHAVEQLVMAGDRRLSDSIKLLLYGLYKQATVGDCNTAQPPFYQLREKSKWSSWKQNQGLSQQQAQQQYIDTLTQVVPDWQEKYGSQPSGSQGAPSKGARQGFGPVFSTMQDPVGWDSEPERPLLHTAAAEGRIEDLRTLLEGGVDANLRDANGCTALHLAVDEWTAGSSRKEVIQLLVANGADVNAQENDGSTPLHYAAIVEQEEDWGFDDDSNSTWNPPARQTHSSYGRASHSTNSSEAALEAVEQQFGQFLEGGFSWFRHFDSRKVFKWILVVTVSALLIAGGKIAWGILAVDSESSSDVSATLLATAMEDAGDSSSNSRINAHGGNTAKPVNENLSLDRMVETLQQAPTKQRFEQVLGKQAAQTLASNLERDSQPARWTDRQTDSAENDRKQVFGGIPVLERAEKGVEGAQQLAGLDRVGKPKGFEGVDKAIGVQDSVSDALKKHTSTSGLSDGGSAVDKLLQGNVQLPDDSIHVKPFGNDEGVLFSDKGLSDEAAADEDNAGSASGSDTLEEVDEPITGRETSIRDSHRTFRRDREIGKEKPPNGAGSAINRLGLRKRKRKTSSGSASGLGGPLGQDEDQFTDDTAADAQLPLLPSKGDTDVVSSGAKSRHKSEHYTEDKIEKVAQGSDSIEPDALVKDKTKKAAKGVPELKKHVSDSEHANVQKDSLSAVADGDSDEVDGSGSGGKQQDWFREGADEDAESGEEATEQTHEAENGLEASQEGSAAASKQRKADTGDRKTEPGHKKSTGALEKQLKPDGVDFGTEVTPDNPLKPLDTDRTDSSHDLVDQQTVEQSETQAEQQTDSIGSDKKVKTKAQEAVEFALNAQQIATSGDGDAYGGVEQEEGEGDLTEDFAEEAEGGAEGGSTEEEGGHSGVSEGSKHIQPEEQQGKQGSEQKLGQGEQEKGGDNKTVSVEELDQVVEGTGGQQGAQEGALADGTKSQDGSEGELDGVIRRVAVAERDGIEGAAAHHHVPQRLAEEKLDPLQLIGDAVDVKRHQEGPPGA